MDHQTSRKGEFYWSSGIFSGHGPPDQWDFSSPVVFIKFMPLTHDLHLFTCMSTEEKLAELTVKDKKKEEEEEETRCASLQSQSSVITVDPPSLPHEEEEEEKGDAVEDLTPRGPITGKPTSYRPNNEAFNHISNKSYSSHSLDHFHNQATPFSPPLQQQQQQQQPPHSQAVSGFSQNSFVQNGFSYSQTQPAHYSMAPQMNTGMNIKMSSSGKRVMDDDEDNPYKYTRPVEESGYGAPQPSFNDLSHDPKMYSTFSQVSCTLSCGGQVGRGLHSAFLCVFLLFCVCECVCILSLIHISEPTRPP